MKFTNDKNPCGNDLLSQVAGDKFDVIHHLCRIFENLVIDALEDITPDRAVHISETDGKRVVDVANP